MLSSFESDFMLQDAGFSDNLQGVENKRDENFRGSRQKRLTSERVGWQGDSELKFGKKWMNSR
ncbi:hypothetical protein OAG56_03230 [Mariniblastus sp.]|jgi:hypothetical protein|nr:hypothetical protein [Mariniblastus sp.]